MEVKQDTAAIVTYADMELPVRDGSKVIPTRTVRVNGDIIMAQRQ